MDASSQRIAEYVTHLPSPLPASTLGTALRKSGLKIKQPELIERLRALAEAGVIHAHPTKEAKNPAPRYWRSPAVEYALSALRATIAPRGRWTEAQLRSKVGKAYADYFDEALGTLLGQAAVFDVSGGGKKAYATERPRATDALTASQVKALTGIVDKVNACRRAPLDLQALLDFLNGGTAAAAPEPLAAALLTEEQLLRWYVEELPRLGGLRSVPIPTTWHRYSEWCRSRGAATDADRFFSLLGRMAEQGKIAFTAHDTPSTLPDEVRGLLRRDSEGRLPYYWTVLP
jgi:hypothetical protein